ncbi:uncharacterized protein [Diadema setosum]|uniref:uncharacterized protein n=1 Tax=Diadema setosum TaxID=31175 RepID=UPI003B3B7962
MESVSSHFSNSSDDEAVYEPLTPGYVLVLLVPLVLLAVVLNGAILAVVLCQKRVRQQHNIFVFNLALGDLFGSVTILLPFASNDENFEDDTRRIWYCCRMASTITYFLVAAYRFLTVRIDPFGTQRLVTSPRCIAACIFTWLLTSLLFFEKVYEKINVIVAVFTCLVIPLTGISYYLIYHDISRGYGRDGPIQDPKIAENRRILSTFATIFFTTALCWSLPLAAIVVSEVKGEETPSWIGEASATLLLLNLVINPLIFWWRSSEFRALLPCCASMRLCSKNAVNVASVSREDSSIP